MGLCTDGVQRQGKDGAAETDVKSGGFCKEIGSGLFHRQWVGERRKTP